LQQELAEAPPSDLSVYQIKGVRRDQ